MPKRTKPRNGSYSRLFKRSPVSAVERLQRPRRVGQELRRGSYLCCAVIGKVLAIAYPVSDITAIIGANELHITCAQTCKGVSKKNLAEPGCVIGRPREVAGCDLGPITV